MSGTSITALSNRRGGDEEPATAGLIVPTSIPPEGTLATIRSGIRFGADIAGSLRSNGRGTGSVKRLLTGSCRPAWRGCSRTRRGQ